jgi:hypothetical protein
MSEASARERSPDAPESPALGLRTLIRPVEAIGFWSAVALPFLYFPLVLSGPRNATEATAAVALMSLHALSLVVGHAYNQR